MTTALILFPRLFLLFILGYFGRKLLSVPFFQLVPCGCELGFKRLALSDLLWQPGRIHFPLAIGSHRFGQKLLSLLLHFVTAVATSFVASPPRFTGFRLRPGV